MTTGLAGSRRRWYYMGSNGVMYANTWTPDGRYVDGSGAGYSKNQQTAEGPKETVVILSSLRE